MIFRQPYTRTIPVSPTVTPAIVRGADFGCAAIRSAKVHMLNLRLLNFGDESWTTFLLTEMHAHAMRHGSIMDIMACI